MEWMVFDTWIVVIGTLCAMACGLLGNFLVLRKMSMMGDAISHAVLPGLAIAFLLTQSRGSVSMFIGAAVVGVLTAVFTQWVHHFGKVEESAAMGVVFTTLFAVGLILIVQGADAVDLDPGCVLYGAIELAPWDTYTIRGVELPRAVVLLGSVFVIDLLFVAIFYKELKISSFDPDLATTVGINAQVMHYLLMVLVAVTAVAAFETVGSILVIAMLIVPGATAHLLTDRLSSMLVVSLFVAAACAVLGHVAAIVVPPWFGYVDTSTAGMMAVMAGIIFLVALLAGPRYGLVSRWVHRTLLHLRITREDVLGLLYRLEEMAHEGDAIRAQHFLRDAMGVGPFLRWAAFRQLTRRGLIHEEGSSYALTEAGRLDAKNLIRSHRLWESYLHKHLSLPVDHLHQPAEHLEHITDQALQERLAAEADRPDIDPQGKRIPQDDQS